MHIISRKKLVDFSLQHPDARNALEAWYLIIKQGQYQHFDEIRQHFPSADFAGKLIVFNIGGNKYRLITAIHFNRQKVYIREVLTHAQYSKEHWKK